MSFDEKKVAELKARLKVVDVIERRGVALAKQGRELVGRCPFHEDGTPSLRVNEGKRVWRCDPCDVGGDAIAFASKLDGTSYPDTLRTLAAEIGFELTESTAKPAKVAEYLYEGADGVVLGVKERWEPGRNGRPKGFIWRGADGATGKPAGVGLYRLTEVRQAIADGELVVVVEGEKCVDALSAAGIVATTNEDGAGKWTPVHAEALRGARVVVVPDNDEPGRRHADEVRRSLEGVAASVRVVELPGLAPKGDAFDHLAAHGAEALRALLAAPPSFEELMAQARIDLIVGEAGATKKWTKPAGRSLADLVRAPRIGVEWLVEGLLTCRGVGIIGAEAKGTKTWMGTEIMIGLSSGTPVFGEFNVPRPRWSLAFFLEDVEGNLQSRALSLVQGRRMDPEKALGRIRYESRPTINLKDDADCAGIIASARSMPEPPGLIFIDPLRDAHTGKENESDDMSQVMHRLRDISKLTGALVVVPHHMGRPQKDKAGMRLAHRLRGSTAIHGAIDCGIYAETKGHARHDKGAWWKNLVDVELREGIGAGMFGLELDVVTERGSAVTAGWAFHKDPKEMTGKSDDSDKDDGRTKVLGYLRREAFADVEAGRAVRRHHAESIAESVGLSRRTAQRHLGALKERGMALDVPRQGWCYVGDPAGAESDDTEDV